MAVSARPQHVNGHSPRRPRHLDRLPTSGPASAIRVAAPRLSGLDLAEAGPRPSAPRSPTTGRIWTRAATPLRCMTCAYAAREAMGPTGCRARRLDALLAPCASSPTPTARATLLALRERRHPARVVSNWDWSLHERLARDGPHAAHRRRARFRRGRLASPTARSSARALQLAGTTPDRDLARRRHARGRRGGRPAAGITPGPDRARGRRRRRRGPFPPRTHTLGGAT